MLKTGPKARRGQRLRRRFSAHKTGRTKRQGLAQMTVDALASSNVGTWEWDIGRDVVRCSAVTAWLFALPTGEDASQAPLARFVEAIHPNDRGRFQNLIDASCQQGGNFIAEYRTMP